MPQTKTTNTTTTPSANWGTVLFSSVYSVLQTISSQLANLINPDQIEQIITALQAGKSVVLEIEDEIATKNFLLQLVTTNGQQQLGLVTTDGHCKILTGNWQRKVTDLVTKMRRQIIDITAINQTQTTTIDHKLIERSQTTITFYDAEAVESGSGKTITFTGEDREQKLQLYLTWLQSYQIEETQTATMPLTATNLLVGTLAVTGTLLTGQIFRQGLTRTLDTMTDRFDYTLPGAVAVAGINSMLVGSRQMPLAAALLSTLIYAQPSHAAPLLSANANYPKFNIADIAGAIKLSPIATTQVIGNPVSGDFNGDGRADLAVATTDKEIDLIYGQSDDTSWPSEIVLPTFVSGGSKGSRIFLSGLGTTATLATAAQDTNQDGIADLVIGLPDENRVITIFGRHDFPATFNAQQIPYGNGTYGFMINDEADSQFGATVGGNAKFLMIGTPTASPQGRADAGITALIPSRAQWPAVVNMSQITSPTMAGTLFSGENPGDESGSGIALVQDQGVTYVFIGAHRANVGQRIKAGKVYAMRYNVSMQGKEITLSSQPTKENIIIVGGKTADKIGTRIITVDSSASRGAYGILGTPLFFEADAGGIWGLPLGVATTIATTGAQINLGTYPQGCRFFNQTGYQSDSQFGKDLTFIPNFHIADTLAVGSPFENMAGCDSAGGVYLFVDPLNNFGKNVVKLYLPCPWLTENLFTGRELASLGNFYGSDRSSLYVSVTGLRIAYIVPINVTFSSSSGSSSSSSLSSSGSYASQSSSSQYASSSSTAAASSSGSTTSSSESSLASSSAASSSASSSLAATSISSLYFFSSTPANKKPFPWWWILVAGAGTSITVLTIFGGILAAKKFKKKQRPPRMQTYPAIEATPLFATKGKHRRVISDSPMLSRIPIADTTIQLPHIECSSDEQSREETPDSLPGSDQETQHDPFHVALPFSESDTGSQTEAELLRQARLERIVRRKEIKIKREPNLKAFYLYLCQKLQSLAIGNMAVASGKVTPSKGRTGKLATGVEFTGDLLHAILPEVGKIIEVSLKWAVAKPLEAADEKRQENTAEKIARLFGLLQTMPNLIAEIAIKLTNCYAPQLRKLATTEESGWVINIKEKSLKRELMQPTQKFAEFCFMLMLSALESGLINERLPLIDQLVRIVMLRPVAHGLPELYAKLQIDKVKTIDGQEWRLDEICTKCGVKLTNGALYTSDVTEVDKYGYCLATRDIAEARGLTLTGYDMPLLSEQSEQIEPRSAAQAGTSASAAAAATMVATVRAIPAGSDADIDTDTESDTDAARPAP